MNRILFRLHSLFGLLSSAVLLLITLTGALMAVGDSLEQWIHGQLLVVVPEQGPKHYDKVIATASKQLPDYARYNRLRLAKQPDQSAVLRYADETGVYSAYFNPYTGQLLGTLSNDLRRVAERVHYSLFLGKWGIIVVIISAFAALFAVITGSLLLRKRWLDVVLFRLKLRKATGGWLWSNVHKTIGVYMSLFAFMMFFTGLTLNFHELEEAMEKEEPKAEIATPYIFSGSVDSLLITALRTEPRFEAAMVAIPQAEGGNIKLTGRLKGQEEHTTRAAFEFSPATLALLHYEAPKLMDQEQQFEHQVEELHTGTFGPKPIKLVYMLFALLIAVLPASGVFLFAKKLMR